MGVFLLNKLNVFLGIPGKINIATFRASENVLKSTGRGVSLFALSFLKKLQSCCGDIVSCSAFLFVLVCLFLLQMPVVSLGYFGAVLIGRDNAIREDQWRPRSVCVNPPQDTGTQSTVIRLPRPTGNEPIHTLLDFTQIKSNPTVSFHKRIQGALGVLVNRFPTRFFQNHAVFRQC